MSAKTVVVFHITEQTPCHKRPKTAHHPWIPRSRLHSVTLMNGRTMLKKAVKIFFESVDQNGETKHEPG
ncbi:hypothetical protein CRE_29171 [Caenorhabditis remanei]|uniref:Uncharacterized protein n=1 Tax=Caenorhabditis remanei TaxID=31234 RepID=E3ND40_CAERE|nr:hypothetical protein CRE_29171 [Caenorhabditis remanei]